MSTSFDEHLCSTKGRTYQKTKRAEDELRTRGRIVDAAEALHGTVGPAHASVSAIAEYAGVTRATVYRHFPDADTLFAACSSQWLSRQRLPDPDAWTQHNDQLTRLHAGLTDLYRYYRSGQQMLTMIHRDAETVPARIRAGRLQVERRWRDTLLHPFPDRKSKTLRVAVEHAMAFQTWRSLCVECRLSNRAAVDLMVGMVAATTHGSSTAFQTK